MGAQACFESQVQPLCCQISVLLHLVGCAPGVGLVPLSQLHADGMFSLRSEVAQ